MKSRRFERALIGLFTAMLASGVSLDNQRAAWAQTPIPYPRIETGQHTARIMRIAIDRSERWLVTASVDKTARVWDLRTGNLGRILRPPIGEAEEGMLNAVAISPDGQRVAVGGFTGVRGSHSHPIHIFDRASGRLTLRSAGFSGPINHLVFSRDGTRLAATFTSGGVRILRAADLSELTHDDDCTADSSGADFDRSGRLITTCDDGFLRLYDASGRRIAKRKGDGGGLPFMARFSPDGGRIAVGFVRSTAVTVVSARDLSRLYAVDTRQVSNGDLYTVAWSRDGRRLFAAGGFQRAGNCPIVAWPDQGHSPARLLGAASNAVMDLATLSDGRVVFAADGPVWGVIRANGQRQRLVLPAVLDHSRNQAKFRVSGDGRRVEFGFNIWDGKDWAKTLARFDLGSRNLELDVSPAGLSEARITGLPVSDWSNSNNPQFDGKRITVFDQYERSLALAIPRDGSGFVLGTNWSLRSFDARGQQRWRQSVPGAAWAVNLTDDSRFVVASLGDGTIRWYDASSGRERLALVIQAWDRRWVLWTPEGFYQASPGGDALIGYHLNQGRDHEGQFVDSSQLSSVFYRPDVISSRIAGDEAAVAQAVARVGNVRTVLAGGLAPNIALVSPASVESEGEYLLTVRITPKGGGVGPLHIRINDAEIESRGETPPGGGTMTQRLLLAPGENKISVAATTRDGKVASQTVAAVVHVKLPDAKPALYVLAVGISHYDDASFKHGVKFAARDAQDFVRSIQAGAAGVYREVNPVILTTREDTQLKRIEREIEALARARPEDVVVIFLAGHGKAYEGEYHFIPSDFLYDSDQAYSRGATLSHRKIEALLKNLGAGKRLLILDTCASGSAVQARSNDEKDAISRLMRSSGRYILAAASPQGKALEAGEQGHGVYSYALIEGLAGAADANRDGRIEVDELALYLARRVPELSKRFGYVQVPMRSAAGESFWIIRTRKR